jgi:hypothetical protein
VAETAVKILQCCEFWHTGKAVGQVYQWWWMTCQEINLFSKFEYHMFYVFYLFVTYLLILPRNMINIGFDILTVMTRKSTVFWDMTLCNAVAAHWRFGGIYHVHLQGWRINQSSSLQKRNIGVLLQDCMASHPRW